MLIYSNLYITSRSKNKNSEYFWGDYSNVLSLIPNEFWRGLAGEVYKIIY
jgi:hypothetical protein